MWNFLVRPNLTMWTMDISNPSVSVLANRPGLAAVQALDAALKATPLSRAGSWLLACVAVLACAWSRRGTPPGAFAIAICGSAIIYMLTFFAVGVASDFRYAYLAVLMTIAGGITIAAPIRRESKSSILKKRPP
jgi:peptidoglycan/LPS O-acetylase OafA/YrhL